MVFGLASAEELVKAGQFTNYAHGIGGTVYLQDEKTVVIKGFTYDGAGPDAFFWAGTSGTPSTVGTILPYPFNGKFYDYEDQTAPILNGRFTGDKDIVLTLPADLKSTDIKWLSVWCRAFRVNFGDLIFPDGLELAASGDVEDDLPPPLVEPTNNAHDPNRHDDDWDSDASAKSEPEVEPSAATKADTRYYTILLSLAIARYLF